MPLANAVDETSSRSVLERIRGMVIGLGRPVHKKLRQKKLALFFKFLKNRATSTLLDVGGGVGIDSEFIPLYRAFERVTVVNLDPLTGANTVEMPNVKYEVGDACALPYDSKSFDWVFSNAVIEHVGLAAEQQQFANEIRRVAKHGYFVTTPNKLFPIEPHTLVPFYQFLSVPWQKRLLNISPYYVKQFEQIKLLYTAELQALFPEATIVSSGFPIVGTSLIAMYAGPAEQ